jgi:hypothetical protein
MELYHVSFREYTAGQTYTAPNPIGYHLRSIQRNEGWINETLDEQSPNGYPLRVASFYACSVLENCQAFIGNKRIEDRNPIFYKVEMDCDLGFPMVLIDRMRKLGQASGLIDTCISEYWTPTHVWKYLEYLSPSMTIIEILPVPESLMANKGRMNYNADFEIANRLFAE